MDRNDRQKNNGRKRDKGVGKESGMGDLVRPSVVEICRKLLEVKDVVNVDVIVHFVDGSNVGYNSSNDLDPVTMKIIKKRVGITNEETET